jgi:hypothetical protein
MRVMMRLRICSERMPLRRCDHACVFVDFLLLDRL